MIKPNTRVRHIVTRSEGVGPDGRLQHKDCGDPELKKIEESKSGQMRMTE